MINSTKTTINVAF